MKGNYEIHSLQLDAKGTINQILKIGSEAYIAGTFQTLGQETHIHPTRYLAAIDKALPSGSRKISLSPLGNGLNGAVKAMLSMGGNLVVGGTFTAAMNANSSLDIHTGGLAFWNTTSQRWAAVGGSVVDGAVHALAVTGNNSLIVGGYFTHIDGVTVNNIAVYTGEINEFGRWSSLGGGVTSGFVMCIISLGGATYVGGTFTVIDSALGPKSAKYLALWDGWR